MDDLRSFIGGLIVGVLVLALILAIVFVVAYVLVTALMVFAGGGILYGGGHALVNYVTAFRNNVKPQRRP